MSGRSSNGIAIGIVTDLDDPQHLGRVKVSFPHLEYQQSYWARLATPMAGLNRGLFFRPEVNDEVLMGFEHGDPRRPYVLGSVWNTEQTPPSDDGQTTQNNWRFIQSRSGHIIKLNDTDGSETIEVIDKSGNHKIIIDTSAQKIQIICSSGNVEVKASAGDIELEAQNIKVKAGASIDIEAVGTLTLKGTPVNIN